MTPSGGEPLCDADLAAEIERQRTELRRAVLGGDARRYAEYFSEDAIVGNGLVIRGRTELEAIMSGMFSTVCFTRVEIADAELYQGSSVAIETGEYRFTISPHFGGAGREISGRFITLWRCYGDRWKIAHEVAHPSSIRPAAVSLPSFQAKA